MPELHSAWLLLLLLPVGATALLVARRRRPPAIAFPTTRGIRPARTLRLRCLRVPAWLRVLAVVLVVLALARPRHGETTSAIPREGIAIQMLLDRSGSMDDEIRYRGRSVPKIEVVKDVFDDFVTGGKDLPGRRSDLIGLTTFARFPQESCPLVTLHDPLLTAVKNLHTVPPFLTRYGAPTRDREEAVAENPMNATAIGEGLKRAVLSLVAAEEDLARSRGDEKAAGYKIRGKVVILLTDGLQNAGMDPLEAAALAKANGVRVYAIVLASETVEVPSLFGARVRPLTDEEREQLTEVPRKIAEETGGRFFLATDGDALRTVYSEIDGLERVELGDVEFRSWNELFAWPLLAGIALLILAEALDATWLRRVP